MASNENAFDDEVCLRRMSTPSRPALAAIADPSNAHTPAPKTVEKPETTPMRQMGLVESTNTILSEIAGLGFFSPRSARTTTCPRPPSAIKETTLSALMPEINLTMDSIDDMCEMGLDLLQEDAPSSTASTAPSSPVPVAAAPCPAPYPAMSPCLGPYSIAPLVSPVPPVQSACSPVAASQATSEVSPEPSPVPPVQDACSPVAASQAPKETLAIDSCCLSTSAQSLPPAPAPTLTPTTIPAPANRRASLGLNMKDQYRYHEPIYSQAEMDATLETSQQQNPNLGAALQEAQQHSEACELRALHAEHKASALCALLARRDAELAAEKSAAMTDRDEATTLRVQMKALAHRLTTIDAESQAALDSKTLECLAAQRQLADAEKAHAEAILEHRRAILQACEADKEAALARHAAEIQALGDERARLAAELAEVPDKLLAAEAKGKQYVYKKVERQFDEGNKEFVKVKRELSEQLGEAQRSLWALLQVVPGCDVANLPAGERSDTDAAVEADKAAQWVAAVQTECAALRAHAAALADKSDLDRAAHAAAAEAASEKHTRELVEAKHLLRTTIVTLEGSLQKAESALAATLTKVTTADAQLSAARHELQETKLERDAQMTMVAKLLTAQGRAEEAFETSRVEHAAAEARCVQLRQMNEEVMGMLESIHKPE